MSLRRPISRPRTYLLRRHVTCLARIPVALGLAGVLTASVAHAAGPTPAPSALSVPAGPASLEGFGPTYDLGPGSALPSLSIPITLSSLPGAVALPLALTYAPGTGVSDFGVDWSLELPSIDRSRSEGLPVFSDDDTLALRGPLGSDDLVRVSPDEFRLKTSRGEVLRILDRGALGYWVVLADGSRWELGASDDELDAGSGPMGTGVYRWRASRFVDARGRSIAVHWSKPLDETPRLDALELEGTPLALHLEYESRPDVSSERYYGETRRRTQRVARIAWRDGEAEIWRWNFRYLDARQRDDIGAVSWLASVEQVAADGTTAPSWQMEAVTPSSPKPSRIHPGVGINPFVAGRTLQDVNGDGVPDVLDGATSGSWTVRYGAPNGFAPAQELEESPSITLASALMLDVNGDAVVDALSQGTDGVRVYFGGGTKPFSTSQKLELSISVDLNDPRLVVADLDQDRHVDLLLATETQTYVWLDLGGSGPVAEATMPALPAELRPGTEGVQVLDVDGDGLVDLARIRPELSRVDIAFGEGWGRFSEIRAMDGVADLAGDARWQLRDIDADGAADLVRIGSSEVTVQRNRGDLSFGAAKGLAFPGLDAGDQAELVDIDGDGALDLLRVTGESGSMQANVLPLASARPGLMHAMTSTMGGRVEFSYASAASMAHEDAQLGNPWSYHAPFALPVLARVTKSDASGWKSVVEHRVRDAYFDPRDREWRGFGALLDQQGPTLGETGYRKERTYDLGIGDAARKNLLLTESVSGPDGADPISTQLTEWQVRFDPQAPQVAVVLRAATDVLWHGRSGEVPARTRTEFEYDEWGNVLVERAYGRIDAELGSDLVGDEFFKRYTYATPTSEAGPRNRVSLEEAFSGDGELLAATRTRYDGVGESLPLGQVERGLWTSQQAWVEDDDWRIVGTSQYDAVGNLVSQSDAEGTASQTVWDEYGLFPIEESRVSANLSGIAPSPAQVVHGTWDRGRGVLSGLVDERGQLTQLRHDGLGRLVAVARPGDSLELPTVRYRYELSAGNVAIVKELRKESGQNSVERSIVHLDGWGRALASVTEDDAGSAAVVTNATRLSAAGRPVQLRAPFVADASALEPGSLSSIFAQAEAQVPMEENAYDPLGRLLESRAFDGRRVRHHYEPLGLVTLDEADLSPQDGGDTSPMRTRYDGLGRVVEVQELGATQLVHGFEWDGQGQLRRYAENGVTEIEWRYDGLGHNVEIDARDAGLWTRVSNGRGQEILRIDGDGNRLETDYDGMGRVLEQRGESGLDGQLTLRHWEYDGGGDLSQRGLLTGIVDESGATTFEWDERGRQRKSIRHFQTVAGPVELSERRRYDAQDRLVELTYADGAVLRTSYGQRGLVVALGEVVPWLERDAAGRPTRMQLGDATIRELHYDAVGRWLAHAVRADEEMLLDMSWSYDARGLVRAIEDHLDASSEVPNLSAIFEHDEHGRLIRAVGGFGEETYSYDAEGDLRQLGSTQIMDDPLRTRLATTLGTQSLTWSAGGRLLGVEGDAASTGTPAALWSWDARGELVGVQSERGRSTATYDEAGMRNSLVERDAGGHVIHAQYVMDDYQEWEDGRLVRWVWLDGERIASLPTDAPAGGWPSAHGAAGR